MYIIGNFLCTRHQGRLKIKIKTFMTGILNFDSTSSFFLLIKHCNNLNQPWNAFCNEWAIFTYSLSHDWKDASSGENFFPSQIRRQALSDWVGKLSSQNYDGTWWKMAQAKNSGSQEVTDALLLWIQVRKNNHHGSSLCRSNFKLNLNSDLKQHSHAYFGLLLVGGIGRFNLWSKRKEKYVSTIEDWANKTQGNCDFIESMLIFVKPGWGSGQISVSVVGAIVIDDEGVVLIVLLLLLLALTANLLWVPWLFLAIPIVTIGLLR